MTDRLALTLRELVDRAALAIVHAGGGLVKTPSGNVYKHRVDIYVPKLIFDPALGREQLRNVRVRITVEV